MPILTVNPTSAPLGSTVTVTGSEFNPRIIVRLYFDRAQVAKFRATKRGVFSADVEIPSNSGAGVHIIKAITTQGETSVNVTATEIQEPPPPPPPPPPPTIDCSVGLQTLVNNAPSGSTLDVTGCTFTVGATISKPLTLVGGTINVGAAKKGIIIASSNVTLKGMTIVGPQATTYNSSEAGVFAKGTDTARIDKPVIQGCTIKKFGYSGMHLEFVNNILIDQNVVQDCVYSGIMVITGVGGTVSKNTVERIGVVGSGANSNNAYGIALTQWVETSPRSTDIVVSDNIINDVPTWQGLDTHGGARITWTRNTVKGCRDGIYITGWPTNRALDNIIDNNRVENTTNSNQYGVTSVFSTGGKVTNNTILGWMVGHEILTTSSGMPDATAINLTVSGNIFSTTPPPPTGVTFAGDWTASMNAAKNAGNLINVPAGTWPSPPIKPYAGLTIKGVGPTTIITRQGVPTTPDVGLFDIRVADVTITDLTMRGTRKTNPGQGDDELIYAVGANRLKVQRVRIEDANGVGIQTQTLTAALFEDITITNVGVRNNGYHGVALWPYHGTTNSTFRRITIDGADYAGIFLDAGTTVGTAASVDNNIFESIVVKNAARYHILNGGIGSGIMLTGAQNNKFTGWEVSDTAQALAFGADQSGLGATGNILTGGKTTNVSVVAAFGGQTGNTVAGSGPGTFSGQTGNTVNWTGTTPPPPPQETIYGPAIGAEGKGNLWVGMNLSGVTAKREVGIRWLSDGGKMVSYSFNQRFGPGYSMGNENNLELSLYKCGTNGLPEGSPISTITYRPPTISTGAEVKTPIAWTADFPAGMVCIMHRNLAPLGNFISVNCLWNTIVDSPRQPAIPDDSMAVLYKSPDEGYTALQVKSDHTAVFDVKFDDGRHEGQAYHERFVDAQEAIIGVTSAARERFTPKVEKRIKSVGFRVLRRTATDLDITLAGKTVRINISGITPERSNDGRVFTGHKWVKVPLSVVLPANIEQTCVIKPIGGEIRVSPLRYVHEWGSRQFSDGISEKSINGGSWQPFYEFDDEDLQLYFELE